MPGFFAINSSIKYAEKETKNRRLYEASVFGGCGKIKPMLTFISNLFSKDRKTPYAGDVTPANIGAAESPGYPPPPNGIPFIPPNRLLDKHADLIATLRQNVGVADPLFERLYLPSIQRMAGFVHMLPASESHHHRGAGGALRHALEVATYTSRASESVMIGSLDLPARRKQKEVAWRYAAFVAGLCHDIGKPVTDLTANTEGGAQWNPMAESLYEWGERAGAEHYYIAWQPNRHKLHEQFYSLLVSKIAGQEGMEYLGLVGHEAVGWVLSMSQAATIEQKKMYEIVTKGDMLSVENDLRTHAGGADVAVAGVNLEKVVQDTLQNRFRLGIWTVNKLGGRAWKTASGVFLVWPIAGGEIIEDLSAMRALGLPRTPDALLAFMIERGIAVRMSNEDGIESPTWKLKIPANNDLSATVTAIKLSEDSGIPGLLSGVAPLPDVEPVGAMSDSQIAESRTAITQWEAPTETSREQASTKPSAKETTPRSSRAEQPSTDLMPLSEMGPHGVILESLRADMTSGKKKPGEDFIRLNDGRLAIAFPEGLKGSGVEPMTILDWLEENGMLETDPYQHDKKTHELDGFTPPKRTRKAILLTRDATKNFWADGHQKNAAVPPQNENRGRTQTEATASDKPAESSHKEVEKSAVTPKPKSEGLPLILERFVKEIRQGKESGNTPFLIEETDEGLFVPRHTSVSWFLKRCDDKSARTEITAQIEANSVISEVQRNGKRMLHIPGSAL